MMAVKFDNTISAGSIISLIIVVLTVLSMSNKWEARLATLEVKVDRLWMAYR